MDEKKLTNLEIANNYRNLNYYLSKCNVLAAFAYWVVYQSPYDTPDITAALTAFDKYIEDNLFKGKDIVCVVYKQLDKLLTEKIFEAIPAIEILNHPKIDNGGKYLFTDRYSKIKPDYDFIDLAALSRNVFYMILRLCIVDGVTEETKNPAKVNA